MANKILLRRDTAVNWSNVDPVLSNGEIGLETDTGKFKIGNGASSWEALTYYMRADDIAAEYNGALTAAVADAVEQAELAEAQVVLATAQKTSAQTFASNAASSAGAAAASAAAAAASAAEAADESDEVVEALITGASDTRTALDARYARLSEMDDIVDVLIAGDTSTRQALDALFGNGRWPAVNESQSRCAVNVTKVDVNTTAVTGMTVSNVPAGTYRITGEAVFDRLFDSGDGATTKFRLGFTHAAMTNNFQSGVRWWTIGLGSDTGSAGLPSYPGYQSGTPTEGHIDFNVTGTDQRFIAIQGIVQFGAQGNFSLYISPTVASSDNENSIFMDHASYTLTRIS